MTSIWRKPVFGLWALLCAWTLAPATAQALPSFSRQTGSECVACHIAGVGWHLTPHGIWFKMNGYTEGDRSSVPLSAQVRVSHNETDLPSTKASDRLDEASIFLAGRLLPKVGAYVKAAHYADPFNTGEARHNELQVVDLRFAHATALAGRDTVFGLTVNNHPGITDPLDANQAWGFPAINTVGTMFNPTTAPTVARRVLGVTGYALFDNHWYAEAGGYRSLSRDAQHRLGQDPEADPGRFSGVAPYWRLAYLHDFKTQFIGAGLYGMNAKRQLAVLSPSPLITDRIGAYDSLRDVGLDAMYEYLGNRQHIVQVRFNHVRERVRYGAPLVSPFTGATAPGNGSVRETTLSLTYVFRQKWAFSAARMATRTGDDAVRYYPFGQAASRVRYFSAEWTPFGQEDSWAAPWANLRVGAVWIHFDRFNGGTTNVFGPFSPNARDLNSFQTYAQVTF